MALAADLLPAVFGLALLFWREPVGRYLQRARGATLDQQRMGVVVVALVLILIGLAQAIGGRLSS